MSAAAGLTLLTLIAQVESAGHTRVLLLDDCPKGLKGFYAPMRNRIGICRNTHDNDSELNSTLLHEAVHRLQHCRQPELADQLEIEHSVSALEEEARALEQLGEQDLSTAMSWLRRQLRDHCHRNPISPPAHGKEQGPLSMNSSA